jgi:hypothetical protein
VEDFRVTFIAWLRRGRGVKVRNGVNGRLSLEALETRTLLSVDLLSTAEGINSTESSCGCQPPDPDAAAGPTVVVTTVNLAIAYYDKGSDTRLFLQPLRNFFAPAGPGSFLSDPVVTYDEMAGRFVVGMLDIDVPGQHGYFDLAVSDTSDPRDGFSEMHKMDITETRPDGHRLWGDYPKLGYNADAYFITLNMDIFFDDTNPDHPQVLTIDKTSVLDRNSRTFAAYSSDLPGGVYAPAAATMHGTAPGDPMYFVQEVTRFGGDRIRVIQMTDVLSNTRAFTSYEIPVDRYQRPPNAVHPGGTIQTFESFVLNADWRDNRLVATHHVGSGGIVRSRWYEFDTSGKSPTLTQSGEIDQGPGVYTYFEAIAVADNGDLGMTFMESSASEFVSMYVTGQQAGDPAGTMQTPVVTHPGVNPYTGSRGGDYSGITEDPDTGSTFWAFSMYKPGGLFWGTGLANFALSSDSGPAAPARLQSARASARPVGSHAALFLDLASLVVDPQRANPAAGSLPTPSSSLPLATVAKPAPAAEGARNASTAAPVDQFFATIRSYASRDTQPWTEGVAVTDLARPELSDYIAPRQDPSRKAP